MDGMNCSKSGTPCTEASIRAFREKKVHESLLLMEPRILRFWLYGQTTKQPLPSASFLRYHRSSFAAHVIPKPNSAETISMMIPRESWRFREDYPLHISCEPFFIILIVSFFEQMFEPTRKMIARKILLWCIYISLRVKVYISSYCSRITQITFFVYIRFCVHMYTTPRFCIHILLL